MAQNGYDCGVYSIDLVAKLIENIGANELLSTTTPVTFPACLHAERKKLLHATMDNVQQSLAIYENRPDWIRAFPLRPRGIKEELLGYIRSGQTQGVEQFTAALTKLDRVIADCPHCQVGSHLTVGRLWLNRSCI